jgi:outer membrane lipoprotein-sorting protein
MKPGYKSSACLAVIMAVVMILCAQPARAEDPLMLAARIKNRYRNINSFSALYERHSRFVAAGSVFNSEVKGSGRLTWQRPFQLRLDQDSPRLEVIVSTGDGVWWVRPDRGRADLYPQEQFTGNLRPLWDALGGLDDLDEMFQVLDPTAEDQELEEGKLILVLKPHKARSDLQRLVLAIDPDSTIITAFRIINLVGDKTDYSFKGIVVNPRLDADTFSFQPSPNLKVVDHRFNSTKTQ